MSKIWETIYGFLTMPVELKHIKRKVCDVEAKLDKKVSTPEFDMLREMVENNTRMFTGLMTQIKENGTCQNLDLPQKEDSQQ